MPDGEGRPHWPGTTARFAFNQALAVDTLPDVQGFVFPTKKPLLGQVCGITEQISP